MARPSQLDAQVCGCGTERSSLSAVNVMAKDWGGALMFISLPADATAALRALAEFFESHQLLIWNEFLRILRKGQGDERLPEQGQGPL